MTEGTSYCFECKRPLAEIDNRGQHLRGCMTCNIWWSADDKKVRLSEVDLAVLHALRTSRSSAEKVMISDEESITAFDLIPGAWLMQFEDGWYAYRDDDPRLGPFESDAEAARAGLEAWRH
jgi:hypothetical protein